MSILDEVRELSTRARIVELSKYDIKGHFMESELFQQIFEFNIQNFPFKINDIKKVFEEVSKFGFIKEVLVDLDGYLIGLEDVYRVEAMILKYGRVRAKQYPIKCCESSRNLLICLAICLSNIENIEYLTYLKVFLKKGLEKLGVDFSTISPHVVNLGDLVSQYLSRISKLRDLRIATEKDMFRTIAEVISNICEFHEVPGPIKMLAIELMYRFPEIVQDKSFSVIAKAKAFIYMAMELLCISYTYFIPILMDSPYTCSLDEVYELVKRLKQLMKNLNFMTYADVMRICMEKDTLPIPSKIYECLLYLSDHLDEIVTKAKEVARDRAIKCRNPVVKFLTFANIYSTLYYYCCRKSGLCLDEERFAKICLEEAKAETVWECMKKTGKVPNDFILNRLYKIYKTTPKITKLLYDKLLNFLDELMQPLAE